MLMAAQFLSPTNAWHLMNTKAEAMGTAHQVIPFMQWIRVTTANPQQNMLM